MTTTIKSNMMTFKIKNEKNLIPFLSSHQCDYEVVNDGWEVIITCNNIQDFFDITKLFGRYLAVNRQPNDFYMLEKALRACLEECQQFIYKPSTIKKIEAALNAIG